MYFRILIVAVIIQTLFGLFDVFYLSRRAGLAPCYRYNASSTSTNFLNHQLYIIAQIFYLFVPLGFWHFITRHRIVSYHHWHNHLALAFLASFVVGDFCYYVWHRLAHTNSFLWRFHLIHHSDRQFNFSTSLRVGVIEGIILTFFFSFPILMGMPVRMLFFAFIINSIYMSWIHSSLPKLPSFIEFIFNTPSHHRPHHELDDRKKTANFGGTLIIWDRIFGTFRPEAEMPICFGVQSIVPEIRPLAEQLGALTLFHKTRFAAKNPIAIISVNEMRYVFMAFVALMIPLCASNHKAIAQLILFGLFLGFEFYSSFQKRFARLFRFYVFLATICGAILSANILMTSDKHTLYSTALTGFFQSTGILIWLMTIFFWPGEPLASKTSHTIPTLDLDAQKRVV